MTQAVGNVAFRTADLENPALFRYASGVLSSLVVFVESGQTDDWDRPIMVPKRRPPAVTPGVWAPTNTNFMSDPPTVF